MRVDDVLFRINDTRLYHEFGKEYFVREYTSKEVHYNEIRQASGMQMQQAYHVLTICLYRNWVGATFHC